MNFYTNHFQQYLFLIYEKYLIDSILAVERPLAARTKFRVAISLFYSFDGSIICNI